MRAAAIVLACALASLAAVACDNAAKREASVLVTAVDRFRRSSPDANGSEAGAVDAVACTDAQVCDAKQACVAAVDPTARALALKAEVAARLVDLEALRLKPDSPEAEALPGKLDEASRLLREGHEKMADCERKVTDLRLTYRL